MKTWAVLVLLLALLAGGAASGLAAADKIEWHTYEAGMARSKAETKKVFLHFYADWCTFCVEMDRKTFKDPAVVAALNRNFIPIRVDSDRNKEILPGRDPRLAPGRMIVLGPRSLRTSARACRGSRAPVAMAVRVERMRSRSAFSW